MRIHKEYKVYCDGPTDLTINCHGFLTLHRIVNYEEWINDQEHPLKVNPLREQIGSAYMDQHQVENLIEVLKLVAIDLKDEDEKKAKAIEKAAKKGAKKTKTKKVKKK